MKTTKTFEINRYLSELQSNILEVVPLSPPSEDEALLILEETIFFPGGGGQSCDLGTINGHEVTKVFEKDGEIYHQVKAKESNIVGGDLSPGTSCLMKIDWDRRFDNMQRHCGEHILSGICYRLWGGVNRGFHMGDDYMTIDISLEDNPEFKEVTWEMVLEAELEANKVIWQDLPVVYRHFDTKADAEGMPLRKELTIEKDITIVSIGDLDNPADSVACCGTHPSTAGQVGLIKMYKVEPNKGMFRIYFDAGRRAFMGYRDRFEVLSKLERDLSSGFKDLMDKYQAKQDKNKEVRDRLYHLTKDVLEKEKASILEDLTESHHTYRYEALTVDDLIELGRSLEGSIPGLLHLVHSPTNTLLLFSDKLDCGKLVKDNVQVFNGKGGGNKKFARGIFNRSDDLNLFIDAVEKLSR